ncbi:MAG: hypothetical protein HZB56_06200 [Deltaproteobacteria bacterium]|nr:hypothetical protein [Deltaproteobacteria bacterium]
MPRRRLRLALALALASSACAGATLRRESAARIGCPADEVTVADYRSEDRGATWLATCDGRTYRCELADRQQGASCRPSAR